MKKENEDNGTSYTEVLNIKTLTGDIPDMQDMHRELYTSVLYEFTPENRVSVKVPENDVKAIKEFREKCCLLLSDIEKVNSTLAHKLARYHKF
ncbi:hypothetical protein OQZ55_18680 [Bacillus subtilis]|uniref:hypothetical protein n=1 Tax=Bacillus TaxID=1386 RepID=UPI000348FAC5|nr:MULTISPECIES: hypothetical protein [Bacillus]KIN31639.1 hypothetical protein B4070_4463 [Bacillus subtilis]MCX4078204.1 hypothetical protein [Bacillus subtilis]MCZ4248158.1 hypothetical protein [Bacillus amyloliquefaciens]MDN4182211.1 hypothetical protein [Bacillus subtilis]QAR59236.1 hypothetical protein BS11774_01210 [Bacillus subtilis]